MPGGAVNRVQVNLSDVVPFIVMKGMALWKRRKKKKVGPTYVVDFDEIGDREERDRIKRDAFERVNAVLDILKIAEYKERTS